MPNPSGGTMAGRSGNGFVRISYTWGTPTISLSVAGGVTKVNKGQSVTLTAAIDFAGKVTFFADGKRIPGCISIQASIGNQNCTWKPNTQKSVVISARIDPNSGNSTTSSPITISVIRRTGIR
jgi:hypothetical protein